MAQNRLVAILSLLTFLAMTNSAFAATGLSADTVTSNSVKLNFATDERVQTWEVCWKLGRYNPTPTCSDFANHESFAGNQQSSGTYTIPGLKSDRWYTFKVRAKSIKNNGKAQTSYRYVGHVQVKTQ